jgi:hypothetical protein
LLPLQQGQGGQQTDAPAIGGGRRLFEVLPSRVELEIVRVIDTPEATHIRYRVRR